MSNVYGGDEVGALVFDFGSSTTRVGYAGEDQPRADIPSVVAVNDVCVGEQTQRKYFTGTVNVDSPRPGKEVKTFFKDGMIDDWDLFQKMLDSIYADVIHSESSPNPVIFSEPVWNTRFCREKITEIMFEHYNIPAFYLAKNAMLSSFSCGRPTALVLDSGATYTTAVPVLEGYVLKNALIRTPFAGDYVTRLCTKQIRSKGYELTPAFMVKSKTPTKTEEKANFVKKNLPEGITSSYRSYMNYKDVSQYKLATVKVYETKFDPEEANQCTEPIVYEFADGHQMELSAEEQFTLMEPFFDPSFHVRNRAPSNADQSAESNNSVTQNVAVPPTPSPATPGVCSYAEIVLDCIEKCDIDMRPALLNSIVVVGGNSLLPGFTERLTNDLNTLAPQNFKVKVMQNNTMVERKFASWIGGSILASLGTFQQLWISKLEYEEQGKGCLDFDA